MKIDPPIRVFEPENVLSGPARPHVLANAWVADPTDENPEIELAWESPVEMGRLIIEFDPDWDHPMESVLMSHPEEVSPFMVRDFDLLDGDGKVLEEVRDHRGARFVRKFEDPLTISKLTLRILGTQGSPAAVFRVRVL